MPYEINMSAHIFVKSIKLSFSLIPTSIRLCVNFKRKVNPEVIIDHYPLFDRRCFY